MIQRKELDPKVSLQNQLASAEEGPLVLINLLQVDPSEADQFLVAWAADAAYFKRQPGCISAQLHRGIAGSSAFINVAVWQDLESFRAAHGSPEFRDKLSAYPDSSSAAPHLFRKVAVENICVA